MVTVTQIPVNEVFRNASLKNKMSQITPGSPQRTSQVAVNPPANKLDDLKKR